MSYLSKAKIVTKKNLSLSWIKPHMLVLYLLNENIENNYIYKTYVIKLSQNFLKLKVCK